MVRTASLICPGMTGRLSQKSAGRAVALVTAVGVSTRTLGLVAVGTAAVDAAWLGAGNSLAALVGLAGLAIAWLQAASRQSNRQPRRAAVLWEGFFTCSSFVYVVTFVVDFLASFFT